MSASITASRFALLKIEGSDDEKPQKKTNKSKDVSNKTAQKKKTKKKQNNDAADLRSLAFGGGKGVATTRSQQNELGTASHQQYEVWVEHDKDQVDEIFQQELQQAILMSKVESEKQTVSTSQIDDDSHLEEQPVAPAAGKKKSKNKSKAKQKAISIDEFQHGPALPEFKGAMQLMQEGGSDLCLYSGSNLAEEHYLDKRKLSGSGDDFFTDVAANAANIVRRDKLQEEYSKQYKVQAVLQAKHNTELEGRDTTIEELRKELQQSQEEMKLVKKRNKQLCFILGQGDMKEKAEILQQVDSLSQIKDELTAQVTSLTSELEREKSKVHSLQNELSKLKQKSK